MVLGVPGSLMEGEPFPRVELAHLPTPLVPLAGLSRELKKEGSAAPQIWIKRDDATGLAMGGNKARKLEFLLGDALSQGADVILTRGATQSNHARQTAAAATICGLDCELLLSSKVGIETVEYQQSGNRLLDSLLGATVHAVDNSVDADVQLKERAEALRAEGRKPYVIPVGGSDAVGALGYAWAATEIAAQVAQLSVRIDALVHGSSSGGTQAGLIAGFAAAGFPVNVLGISADESRADLENIVTELAQQVAVRLGGGTEVEREAVVVDDRFVGPGYGKFDDATKAAVRLVARTDGVLLDPVYSGKAMAGLMALCREGRFSSDDNLIFLHTGGAPALFAYREGLCDE